MADENKATPLRKAAEQMIGNSEGLTAFGREVLTTSAAAAAGAGVVAGTVSAIRNGISLCHGTITARDALATITGETASSALRAAATGGLSVTIRHTAEKVGLDALKRGDCAGALAGAALEIGRTVCDLAMGRITPGDAADSLGATGCAMIAGAYAGGAATAAFGNAGVIPLTIAGIAAPLSIPVLVSTTAASIVVSLVYQNCRHVFKTAELDQTAAEQIIALAASAAAELTAQRQAFDAAADACFQTHQTLFDDAFATIDQSLACDDTETMIRGLTALTESVGGSLRFPGFDAFTRFMEDPDTTLRL